MHILVPLDFGIYRPDRILFLFSILVCSLCNPVAAAEIGLFYALDRDAQAFVDTVRTRAVSEEVQASILSPASVQVNGHTVHLIHMGSGCVKTAVNVTRAIAPRSVQLALSCGVVGGLDPELEPGDWVRIGTIRPYQDISQHQTGPSEVPTLKPIIPNRDGLFDQDPDDVFAEIREVQCASGETFIAEEGGKKELYEWTGAEVVDMNLFGLHTALEAAGGIPAFHLRVVSDLADQEASADFRAFREAYDGEGGRRLAELVLSLPAARDNPNSYPALRSLMERNKQPMNMDGNDL